jgi:hypothetical protein
MERSNLLKRLVTPILMLLLLMVCSWIVYNLAWRLDNHLIHRALALVSGTLLFLSVAFGAAVVYPLAYFRGASLRERVIVSSITPFIWMTKECARLYVSFSFSECLYYYFNALNIWLICALCMEMAFVEMICRWVLRRRGEKVKVLGFSAVAVAGLSLAVFLLMFMMGQGETFYARYLELYRFFFNAGAGIPVVN